LAGIPRRPASFENRFLIYSDVMLVLIEGR
jgi:hypothetical protein